MVSSENVNLFHGINVKHKGLEEMGHKSDNPVRQTTNKLFQMYLNNLNRRVRVYFFYLFSCLKSDFLLCLK